MTKLLYRVRIYKGQILSSNLKNLQEVTYLIVERAWTVRSQTLLS